MKSSMDTLRTCAPRIVALLLLAFFILSTVISSQESATFDERAHIPAAYTYVDASDMRLNPEHPPLIKDLSGIPLQFLSVSFPYKAKEWRKGINEQWVLGDLFLNCTEPKKACNDADAILLWSRLPITLIAVFLGIGIFLWTRELGGTLAGLFATLLYVTDPNIIAHSHYVTTDIGSAAFIFFAFYFFVRFLKYPSLRNMAVAGIFLGLAELTKFSAVLLFPIFGLFTMLYALTKQKPSYETRSVARFKFQTLLNYLFRYAGSILVCFTLIWSLYAWNTLHMPEEKLVELADQHLSQNNLPARFAHTLVVDTSASRFLKPLSEYFLGVAMVFARVASGNVHYFLGVVSDRASMFYFPVVFLLKETLPFLFLLLASAGYGLYRISKVLSVKTSSFFSLLVQSFQSRIAQYLSVFFILFYTYVSVTGNLTIGFRHLFPILPFLYMLIAKTLFDFLKHQNDPLTRKAFSLIVGGFSFVLIAIPVLSYPSYLSYFNAAAGGHTEGYRYVTDSNYDWGQDLKHLKVFIDDQNRCATGGATSTDQCLLSDYPAIDKIRVDYFGGSKPAYYLGDKYIPWWDERPIEPGWYAISAFFYQESLYKPNPSGKQTYAWLSDYAPIARAGDAFFIYYIPAAGD